jgi:hypothetical protein
MRKLKRIEDLSNQLSEATSDDRQLQRKLQRKKISD